MNEPFVNPEIFASHRLRVRYAETDQMGVVYHANYLIWFHEARDALLSDLGVDAAAFERSGYRFPLTEISCRYFRPAHYGDEIEVRAHLAVERSARMRFRFETLLAPGMRLLATGLSVSVITDDQGKQLLRPPEVLANAVSRASLLQSRQRTPAAATDD